jgi:hypothetical protein
MRKSLIIISVILVISLVYMACAPLVEVQLAGEWESRISDPTLKLTLNEDGSFIFENVDDGITISKGDEFSYSIEDYDKLTFNITDKYNYTDDQLEAVEQPNKVASYFAADVDTQMALLPPADPIYLLFGIVYKGGSTSDFTGEWKASLEYVETDGGSTTEQMSTDSITLNADGTYVRVTEPADDPPETSSGTYVLDEGNKTITLEPTDSSDVVFSYMVFEDALLLAEGTTTPEFEGIIFDKMNSE